ncbi:BACON domain-containing protein [Zunongwangia endophytica]|uniref:BACON domain-containing protein n=1 Tax=Zunongwangia endophytica TaxID=1808945 RepID=A0ABV8H532_9FLAO|nr:hypothetical protein [Zunongwangia endophytica]MDN3595334.1 hypothetical protein [Zunongwangia endophytica]
MPDNPHEGYELGLNPRSLSIKYKKFSGVIPNEMVALLWRYTVEDNVEILDAPQWLFVILEEIWRLDSGKVGRSDYKIAINENIANNLAPGNYSADIKIRGTVSSNLILGGRPLTYTLQINLTILEGTRLDIDNRSFKFEYRRGQNPPASQFLRVTSEKNWQIVSDQQWLRFSPETGQGNTLVTVTADPAGITTTTNRANYVVSDGDVQIQGVSFLYIFGSTGQDYINASKELITFAANYQETVSLSQRFQIDSSMNTQISTSVSWLEVNPVNNMSGVREIEVTTINTELLEIGSYNAVIEIEGSNFGSVFIDVVLDIVEQITQGLESGKLYYAGDRNKIQLGNAQQNAEIYLNFITSGTLQTQRYTRRTPYFRNTASIIIGQETETLLRPQNLPTLNTQNYIPVIPIRYDFKVFDKQMGQQLRKERADYSNILFLNGNRPLSNSLCYIPEILTIPNDGILALSWVAGEMIDVIEIAGDIQSLLPVTVTGKVQSFIFNASDFSLSTGQSFQIKCGQLSIQVIIKPADLPTTHLIWLNEWDCPEIFNCDGIFKIIDEEESTIATRNRDGKEYSTIVEVQEPQDFEVGTGNIYSEEEVQHLATILRSKRVWIQHGQKRWEVLRDFRNLVTSETRRHNRNFNLKFNLATK